MIKATPQEILDKAITLKDGGYIVMSFNDYADMEAFRSMLYKTRNVVASKNKTLARQLYISRHETDKGWNIIVSKETTISNVVIVEDGEVKPFERTELPLSEENESDRMIRLMKEDGKSDEEIEDILSKKWEGDFDKAASILEAEQEKEIKMEGGEE